MESTSTMLRKAMSVILASTMLAAPGLTESLLIEGIDPATASQPDRGATKAEVIQEFGEPAQRLGPVGEPPISSWEYTPFVVYFEFDRVVHTVAKR